MDTVEEKTIHMRFMWPESARKKIIEFQGGLIAKWGRKVTFEDALLELIKGSDIKQILEKIS